MRSGQAGISAIAPPGQPEDAVLRHREAQRLFPPHSGIEAAQHARDDAVADRDDRIRPEIGEKGGDAPGEIVIGLAVGAAEIPFPAAVLAGEEFRRAAPDLALVEPVPAAERDLAQPLVDADRTGMAASIAGTRQCWA